MDHKGKLMQQLLVVIFGVCIFSYFLFSSKTGSIVPIFSTDEAKHSRYHLLWSILFAVLIHVSLHGIFHNGVA